MIILGITDERNDCDCCGRTNLKCTVALERVDQDGNGTGDVVYYGRDCAARAICGSNKSKHLKNVESMARGIEYARKWLRHTDRHTADAIASAIRVKFCPARPVGEFEIEFNNGVKISR